MGVLSHDPNRAPTMVIVRPPGQESRSCDGKTFVEEHIDGPRWVSCNHSAVWAITEVSYCAHHLPTEWFELAQQRRAMWVDYATELWRDILAITS